MTSTLPPLVQAFSGAFGSAAANAASYPLDLVTTRLQTTRSTRVRGLKGALHLIQQIIERHGWTALYDGLGTDTAATVLSNFLYYYFYSFLRSLLLRRRGAKKAAALGVLEELGLGYVAGLASRLVSTPLSVITVTVQTEREDQEAEEASTPFKPAADSGLHGVIARIQAESGILGFWRGQSPLPRCATPPDNESHNAGFSSAIPLALTPALTLLLFQLFRRVLPRADRERPTPGQAFVGGAVAQSIATTLLYPLILAKTRIQTARAAPSTAASSPSNAPNIWDVWRAAYAREGLPGVYQGLEAQVLKGVVSQGLTLMVKTRIEMAVVAAWVWRDRLGGVWAWWQDVEVVWVQEVKV
ncbi:hypothetical protein HWV62_43973 [Athelia sp. TMB]|nr:hypothetical protein HWV62_43973 [Athelia sp. TMB]